MGNMENNTSAEPQRVSSRRRRADVGISVANGALVCHFLRNFPGEAVEGRTALTNKAAEKGGRPLEPNHSQWSSLYNYRAWPLSISSSVSPFNETTASPSARLPVWTEALRWRRRQMGGKRDRRRRKVETREALMLLRRYVGGHYKAWRWIVRVEVSSFGFECLSVWDYGRYTRVSAELNCTEFKEIYAVGRRGQLSEFCWIGVGYPPIVVQVALICCPAAFLIMCSSCMELAQMCFLL